MKSICLLTGLLCALAGYGQRVDSFSVRKVQRPITNNTPADTFIQRTYLSEKRETIDRIVYRTGIKITSPNTLILFRATQSILNTMGVGEDKNATLGEYYKLPCSLTNDSIFFIVTQKRQSGRAPGNMLEIVKGYSGTITGNAIWMEINTTSNSNFVLPKREEERFVLFKEEPLIATKIKP